MLKRHKYMSSGSGYAQDGRDTMCQGDHVSRGRRFWPTFAPPRAGHVSRGGFGPPCVKGTEVLTHCVHVSRGRRFWPTTCRGGLTHVRPAASQRGCATPARQSSWRAWAARGSPPRGACGTPVSRGGFGPRGTAFGAIPPPKTLHALAASAWITARCLAVCETPRSASRSAT